MERPKFRDPKDKIKYCIRYAENDCWEWTAGIGDTGYGRLRWNGKTRYAHRVSYQAFKGEVPKGYDLDHLCRNRKCVNPDHLEPVTRRENILRGLAPAAANARKTTCKYGHPLDLGRRSPEGKRHRQCSKCKRQAMIREVS